MTQGSRNASDGCVMETVPSVRHVDTVRASRASRRQPVPDRVRDEAGIQEVRDHLHEHQHEQRRGERQDSAAAPSAAAYDAGGGEQQTWQTEHRSEEEPEDRQDDWYVVKCRQTPTAEARRVRTGIHVHGRVVTRLPGDGRDRPSDDGHGDRAQDEQAAATRESIDPLLTTSVLAVPSHGPTVKDQQAQRSSSVAGWNALQSASVLVGPGCRPARNGTSARVAGPCAARPVTVRRQRAEGSGLGVHLVDVHVLDLHRTVRRGDDHARH